MSDAAGVVVERYTYSAYGESGAEGDAGFPFRFTGQKLDAETGPYYYKARYYDPETGGFLQTDPIGYRDQMNLYAYVGNDPINLVDPSGREQEAGGCEYSLNSSDQCRSDGETIDDVDEILPEDDELSSGMLLFICITQQWVGACTAFANRVAGEEGVSEDVAGKRRESKPTDAPTGTKPIDESGLGREKIHKIKEGIGANPKDYVGITPDNDIIITDPDTGKSEDAGNVSDYD